MHSDTVVVEIIGALKENVMDGGHRSPCADLMGLKWVPVPVAAAFPRKSGRGFRASLGPDYSVARVNASLLNEYVDLAVGGRVREALTRYVWESHDPACRGAARRSASAYAPALPVSVAAGGGGAAAAGADAAAGAARICDSRLDTRVASI